MRFIVLALPIVFGGALAGPCRPSSVESSLTTTSSETTALVDVTTTVSLSSTFAVTQSTEQSTDDTTTALSTTETISISTTTSMAESTTESTAAATSTTAPSGQCRAPASLQCCQAVGTATNGAISSILRLLGIVVQDPNILIGATCSSSTNAGSCPGTPLCCNDNSHGGLISIGCTRV